MNIHFPSLVFCFWVVHVISRQWFMTISYGLDSRKVIVYNATINNNFIGEWNRCNREKNPQTCQTSLTMTNVSHNAVSNTPPSDRGSNLHRYWLVAKVTWVHPRFLVIVVFDLVFYVVFCKYVLSSCSFLFGNCIVVLSVLHRFVPTGYHWWYLQTVLRGAMLEHYMSKKQQNIQSVGMGNNYLFFWNYLFQHDAFVSLHQNNRPGVSHRQTLSHNFVSSTHRHEWAGTHDVIGDMNTIIAQFAI